MNNIDWSKISLLISFLSIGIALVAVLYSRMRTKALEKQFRINTCFAILDQLAETSGQNYKEILHRAKLQIVGHIVYGDKYALQVEGDSLKIREDTRTLVPARFVKRLLEKEKPG